MPIRFFQRFNHIIRDIENHIKWKNDNPFLEMAGSFYSNRTNGCII